MAPIPNDIISFGYWFWGSFILPHLNDTVVLTVMIIVYAIAIPSYLLLIPAYAMHKALKIKFKDFTVVILEKLSSDKEEIAKPNWKLSLKIWWAFYWRSMLLAMIVGGFIGLTIGFYISFSKSEFFASKIGVIFNIVGVIVGIPTSLYIIKKILNKKFKTFSIYTVANTTDTTEI